LHYLIDLASELGFLAGEAFKDLNARAEHVVRQLERLIQELETLLAVEREQARRKRLKKKINGAGPRAHGPELI